jgi:hypothetical protein
MLGSIVSIRETTVVAARSSSGGRPRDRVAVLVYGRGRPALQILVPACAGGVLARPPVRRLFVTIRDATRP